MRLIATTLYTTLLIGAFCFGGYGKHYKEENRALLSDIETLTFYDNKMTSGRRSSPITQMTCKSGYSKCKHAPSNMQCYNRGSDGIDVQWECKAELENGFFLGRSTVSCEGYNYPEDPYILAGSCGVEFEIVKNSNYYSQNHYSNADSSLFHGFSLNPFRWFSGFFSLLFKLFLILFFISMIGLNSIFSFIGLVFKVVFFPLFLMKCCCKCCCHQQGYHSYMSPPPPVYDNSFGNGWLWYLMGQNHGRREQRFCSPQHTSYSVPVHSTYNTTPRTYNTTHTSTSYASTKRR